MHTETGNILTIHFKIISRGGCGGQLTAVPATLPNIGYRYYRQHQLGYFPSGDTTRGKIIPRSRDILCWYCFGLMGIWANSDIQGSVFKYEVLL